MKKALILVLLLVIGACGSDSTDASDTTIATAPESSAAADDAATESTIAETTTTTTVAIVEGTPGELVVFRDAAAASSEITSARFEGTINMAGGPDLAEPVTIYVEGAFADGLVEMNMDMSEAIEGIGEGIDLSAFGDFSDIRFIFDGENAYLSFPVFAAMGVETEWVEMPGDSAVDTVGVAGITTTGPLAGLDVYAEANGQITELGTERIRGVDTTHYSVVFDVADLAEGDDEVAADLSAAGIEELPIEVWIGEDGLVYRYLISYDDIEGVELETFSLLYEVYDYGEDVGINVPDPDEVTSLEDLGGLTIPTPAP